ncbi:hypothetical protein CC85DRAFT_331516 [Cutaneotrichosporon oleaginosum]|uniref:Uncharacterized protein n=1 Tax=Cutaneotrichosporon oleaginosum TaxID=879819 RepID=A0A0J0XBY7_9TREE|nr:uncharacterized protein CC85DRAFT_331516 [Cutaneotrichosporon oleaginosum]KLT38567.1 hypothetical protein CC85DRAFT_331516 [Cutaneotrichosporon oleaginosum]TXT08487.1 hypothetical protein COLE_05411 [Cutaneotrichosporon oleaginosum]
MTHGSDWRGGGLMFAPSPSLAPARANANAKPMLYPQHLFDERNAGPGGTVPPPTQPHSERHYDSASASTSPTPPLSSASSRPRSRSVSPSTARSPSSDDHDPILPHTQAYHQALRHASGSHSPYSSFPSFIVAGPQPPPPPSPRKRSHSPARPVQLKRAPSSSSKSKSRAPSPSRPKSRPSSPTKLRSRPDSPFQAKPSPSRTPTPPYDHRARTYSRNQPPPPPPPQAASASRSRPTTPSTPTFAAAGAVRSRIPQRPRAYSASAVEAQEILADPSPPPLPPLPLADHARALEAGLASANPPRQAFPGAPYTADMSVSTRAPEAVRLPGSSSGIPILKTRVRSSPRSPSPDFPDGAERLADELPPFRVDLDAALAEIEDELEVRAHERFVSALPAPRTPNSATFANVTPGSTPPSSIGPASVSAPVSKIRPPKQRTRPSLPNGVANGASATNGAAGTSTARKGTKPRAGSVPLTPNSATVTPRGKDGLGRAASYSTSPEGRSKSMPRRRHGSDTAQLAQAAAIRRNTPTLSTPPAGRRAGTRSSTNTRSNSMSNRTNPSPPTQSQSKLGIAAHFVPPETTFTPPKGADWDDVVLPTVARKTGITVSQNGHSLEHGHKYSHSASYSLGSNSLGSTPHEDDLLAVEWDKEGTPIRWERQRPREGLSEDDFAANRAAAGAQWAVDDFGAPKRDGKEESIEMAPLRNPPSQLQPAPTPTRPPRAAGRSPQSSPQPVQQPFAGPPPTQRPAHGGQGGQGGHAKGAHHFPRPMEVAAPQSPKSSRSKHGRKRRDEDDIKTGGCGCVIM